MPRLILAVAVAESSRLLLALCSSFVSCHKAFYFTSTMALSLVVAEWVLHLDTKKAPF